MVLGLFLYCLTLFAADEREDYAARLVDSPFASKGDDEQALADLVRQLAEAPQHPLTYAALRLARARFDQARDPDAFAEAILALDPSAFDARAAREWLVLSGLMARRGQPLDSPRDFFPSFQREFFVLGPLGPRVHVRPWTTRRSLFEEPELASSHSGIDGEVAWRPLQRRGQTRFVAPNEMLQRDYGTCLLANVFDVTEAGPCIIEVEVRFPSSAVNLGAGFSGAVAGFEAALNGSAPVRVDFVTERPLLWHGRGELVAGTNQLVLGTSLMRIARGQFAVRVLTPEGRPYPGLRERREVADVAAVADSGRLVSLATGPTGLALEPGAGPFEKGVLGGLLVYSRQEIQGIQLLREGVQLQPDSVALRSVLVSTLRAVEYLPRTWSQGRARKLAEEIIAQDPTHFMTQMYLADLYAAEDQEEEALTTMRMLAETYPDNPRPRVGLFQIYSALGMQAAAEQELFTALELAPRDRATLAQVLDHYERRGLDRKAAEVSLQLAAAEGGRANSIAEAALALADIGEVERARELFEQATAGDFAFVWRYVDFLIEQDDDERASELVEAALERAPRSLAGLRRRADLARRAGDSGAELAALRRIHELEPSYQPNFERLQALTQSEPEAAFFAQQLLDATEVIAGYDEGERSDSQVSVLDHGLIYVHPDGSWAQVTQNIYQARDLAACEAMGKLDLPGEVIAVATIKRGSGERHEPVWVGGEYVMPSLEPGDFVEATYRTVRTRPLDDRARLGGWFFASVQRAFERSRYVVSIPNARPERIVTRNLDGIAHSTTTAGERTVHVFDALDQARVLPEPAAPPVEWFLPFVEYGGDEDLAFVFDYLAAEVEWFAQVTPEIAREAQRVAGDLASQKEQARALYRHIDQVLDKREPALGHATRALVAREGNPVFLYLALLRALQIDCDLVWSRASSPSTDPSPEPPFIRTGRWRELPLVVVRPTGAEPAWCDLSIRLLPYGVPTGRAPGAEGIASLRREFVTTPVTPLEDSPSTVRALRFAIRSDGSAQVSDRTGFKGFAGFQLKEQLRNIPEQQRSLAMRQMAARSLPGIQLESAELVGIDSADQPVEIAVDGVIPRFLDEGASGLTCNSPLTPLRLRARFASEGERKLPLFVSAPIVDHVDAVLELPPDLELAEAPETSEFTCPGGTYTLRVEAVDATTWRLERRVLIDGFALSAEEAPGFLDFCAQVDRLEARRLRFVRRD